jgi:flagella basal body P-ring formation protein FlgA
MLGLKKPGTGIPAAQLDAVVGRVLKRAVTKDTPLLQDDLV